MIENMDTDQAIPASTTTESLAMCDFPPTTADPLENYLLDSGLRTVGQIVTAYCKNTTLAVVRCMPDLKWNATVPPCLINDTSRDNMSTVLIILWVVGGLLLIALVVLIVVIFTSKSKTNRCLGRNSSPSSSVFHISGRDNGQGARRSRGGDNPAFSRADEICGEWSYYRGDAFPDCQRLPSYHEAIANSCMTAPVRTRQVSQQDPPVNNSASPLDSNNFQSLGINLRLDSSNLVRSQITTGRVETETNLEQSAQRIQNVETSDPTSDATTEQGTSANQVSSSSDQRSAQANSDSRRYAENYPRCFFEDEPPPPYSFQSSNFNPRSSAQQQQATVSGQHPIRTRSVDVPSSRTGCSQDENNFRHNENLRRSLCDRLANTRPENGQITNRQEVLQSAINSNNNQVYSIQNETRYSTRPNGHICRSPSDTNNLLSDISNTNPSTGLHLPRHSRPSDEQIADHTLGSHIQSSMPRPNVLRSIPPAFSLTESSTGNVQQYNVPEILTNDNHNYNSSHVPVTQDSMYIIRSYLDSQSAMPYSSFNNRPQHQGQTQPLGTSTPLNQSPMVTRRFGPADHPSPLPIPRNHAFHRPGQELSPLRYYDSEVNRPSHVVQGPSSVPQSVARDNHPSPSCCKLNDLGTAPLARFDTEYTYL